MFKYLIPNYIFLILEDFYIHLPRKWQFFTGIKKMVDFYRGFIRQKKWSLSNLECVCLIVEIKKKRASLVKCQQLEKIIKTLKNGLIEIHFFGFSF